LAGVPIAGGVTIGDVRRMKRFPEGQSWYRRTHVWAIAVLLIATATTTMADTPGRGRTAAFEISYLRFIINHHFSALRMTELAAGTDQVRDAAMAPGEGTAPTEGFPSTPSKSRLDEIKSMARMANRMQREEIATAQQMLRDWYSVEHRPVLTPDGQRLIDAVETAASGRPFDQAFLMNFSRHHYTALQPSLDCQVHRELEHDKLDRYCRGIVHAQVNEITEMRMMLCREFSLCDYQPSQGQ
jgi:uncharacterized protein (DUF305 family)